MKRPLPLAMLFAAGVPNAAHSQSNNPAIVAVELTNFRFDPQALHLRAGVPIVLRLHNGASGGHNFTAVEFFSSAKVSQSSAAAVHNGTVEVPKHGTVDISLMPSAGSYRLRCSHTFHSAFGMKGVIRVD